MPGQSTTKVLAPVLAAAVILAGCGRGEPEPQPTPTPIPAPAPLPSPVAAPQPLPPYEPPAPGEPGGLPDDRTPISEAPFTPESAQGAANVVQTYYALVDAGKYVEAYDLWADTGRASGLNAAGFAQGFGRYREFHAHVGAPGEIEGAAGSLYVEVPVQEFGRLASGEPFNRLGTVTLRRVNDVPGSTAVQRTWHIQKIDTKQAP